MERIDIYVDGSYSPNEPNVAYGGYVLLYDNKPIRAMRVSTSEASLISMNNVGGELTAVMLALNEVREKFLSEDLNTICIHYDYIGIEKWLAKVNGWAAKKEGTQKYVKFVSLTMQLMPQVQLKFKWVKGHSGDKWNEVADKIARGYMDASAICV